MAPANEDGVKICRESVGADARISLSEKANVVADALNMKNSSTLANLWSHNLTLLLEMRSTKLEVGQLERTIQTLEDTMRACTMKFKDNWDDHLPLMEFANNQCFHSSIENKEKIQIVKKCSKADQDRQKNYIDKHQREIEYEIDDKVFLKVSLWKGILRFGKEGKIGEYGKNSSRWQYVSLFLPLILNGVSISQRNAHGLKGDVGRLCSFSGLVGKSRAYEDCILDMASGGCVMRHGHHKPYPVHSEYVARTVDSKRGSVPCHYMTESSPMHLEMV
ncbi:hypothetical protein Sango_0657700 [Sesamum angolense]|uniref:Uncharacterized protein n=1 Tax=Sesamum angolense TaxID=2727404 RepID=A0AAE1X7Y7_9LAMI|nr:hypothetical protein Sango_0657700 [Sesamum angolense]